VNEKHGHAPPIGTGSLVRALRERNRRSRGATLAS
jgi:hypothetical protein